uniref:Uncharacterized protein n=1 Tax=viral metagenome TaxID=1070528 RepID=A0A6C0L033_9ZZZZ|tara:strand:- start:1904 stop:2935 length:1032 start_codon:yes stop_codon:yes gene_type:complete
MEFITFAKREIYFSDQLFKMIKGISSVIQQKGSNLIVLDTFLCDYDKNYYTPISNIFNLQEINVYLKKYNITLIDKHNFQFELLKVEYGTSENNIDITQEIKEKFYENKKLFINKTLVFNSLKGDPCFNTIKKVWISYNLNGCIYNDEYSEVLHKNIDYTNENYKYVVGVPNKNENIFQDILSCLIYNRKFYDLSASILSKQNITNKVNVIHLIIEDESVQILTKRKNLLLQNFKAKLSNKYIQLIKDHIQKSDTTIILTKSLTQNPVIEFLNQNNYNNFIARKHFEHSELNAIADFIHSKKCNNVFIGNFNYNTMNGSSLTYYIKNTINSNITYKSIDLDQI